jgi:hypothetical protein
MDIIEDQIKGGAALADSDTAYIWRGECNFKSSAG